MLELKLTKEEFEYLMSAEFLPDDLRGQLLKTAQTRSEVSRSGYRVELSEEVADAIRDLCGEQLQVKGFDANYLPTKEGSVLESLIDKLFVG